MAVLSTTAWKSDKATDKIFTTKEEAQKWEASLELEQTFASGKASVLEIAEEYIKVKIALDKIGQ